VELAFSLFGLLLAACMRGLSIVCVLVVREESCL
jgi:hypothetical protein